MAHIFEAKILTPEGAVFEGDALSVKMPGSTGSFAVLRNHAPIVADLLIGLVTIKNGTQENIYSISGGVVEVQNNQCVVLANTAERSDLIDMERAKSSLERAQERKGDRKYDQTRVEASMSRALNRLQIAQKN